MTLYIKHRPQLFLNYITGEFTIYGEFTRAMRPNLMFGSGVPQANRANTRKVFA